MRLHNGTILVTEPVQLEAFTLTTSETPLPSLPTGDLGRNVLQVTVRVLGTAWEWTPDPAGDWFKMLADEILVIPVRDRVFLEALRLRAVGSSGDCRIIYEC